MSGAVAPRLYYMPRTRSSRVLWLLEEIGAPYELTEIAGAEMCGVLMSWSSRWARPTLRVTVGWSC